jgi:cysteine-rich repeat protein
MDNNDLCTNACTNAVCGDGFAQPGEQCDDGDMDNNDLCTNACTNAVCGDSFVQPGEQCDDANMDPNDGCDMCQISVKLVFVTSVRYDGNLGGIIGADQKCNMLAAAAPIPLPGNYMAWISTNVVGENPAARFTQSMIPYVMVNGTKIADNWADLTDGSLDAAISRTELNGPSPNTGHTCEGTPRLVRTGTAPDGTAPVGMGRCNNFTGNMAANAGSTANTTSVTPTWSACSFAPGPSCTQTLSIYCFQQ